jgi:MmeI, N-terminal domain
VTPSEFLEKWSGSAAAERSNAQSFVIDLCAVLNVDPPHAATSDADRDAYVFEKPVTVAHEGRQQSIGFIDLFKRGHFILEAKQGSEESSSRLGTASMLAALIRSTSPQCFTARVRDGTGVTRTEALLSSPHAFVAT